MLAKELAMMLAKELAMAKRASTSMLAMFIDEQQ